MARFTVRKLHFGGDAGPDEDDDGRDLPRPHLLRLRVRRAAGIAEAAETLALLPGPSSPRGAPQIGRAHV